MNGRQARGCGMSAQERTNTATKKTANSMVGKLTARIVASGPESPALKLDLGMPRAQVLYERLAHPAALVRARHPVAAEQLLLALERQAGQLPAHGQPLEEELAPALPAVLGRGRRARVEPLELAHRPGAERVPQ